jgi:hypothetical protein
MLPAGQSSLILADPVWAFRKNYEPKEVLFEAINKMQRHLAEMPPESTTLDVIRGAYQGLWRSLEEKELVVVTAHTTALMSEDQWLLCQQSAIARRRDGR